MSKRAEHYADDVVNRNHILWKKIADAIRLAQADARREERERVIQRVRDWTDKVHSYLVWTCDEAAAAIIEDIRAME